MPAFIQPFFLLSLGVFGLIFGSFANVLIWRFPRGESVVTPGSHCPSCGSPVRGYDNIPVVSWMVLRGRCRDCGEPIHWRYPIVEALSGALWVLAGVRFGLAPQAAVAVMLFYLLLVLAFIDLDTMRLPNPLVAVVALIGVIGVAVSQLTGVPLAPLTPLPASGPLASPVAQATLGVLLGGGLVGGLGAAYGAVRGRRGFGMGDVKLIAVAGLFLGPYVLVALMLSSLLGLLGAIALVRGGEGPVGARRFPFGPFLAVGITAAALVGPPLMAWYLALVGM